MKKLYTFIILLINTLAFSQENDIYCAIFENPKNFEYLNFYNQDTKKNMDKFRVMDSIFLIRGKEFKYDEQTHFSDKLGDSIISADSYPGALCYGTHIKKMSLLFTETERDSLYFRALKAEKNTVNIVSPKVEMISTIPENNWYFLVSNIIYTTDNKTAFVTVYTRNNSEMWGDRFYGISFFIMTLKHGKWKQTHADEQGNL
ncbi:hypothetical protein [Empedobacter brevis]|nr:hypothetical protein [Empedobacter brevis]